MLTSPNSQGQNPGRGPGGRRGGGTAEAPGRDGHVRSPYLVRCWTGQSTRHDEDAVIRFSDWRQRRKSDHTADRMRGICRRRRCLPTGTEAQVLIQELVSVTGVGVRDSALFMATGREGRIDPASYTSSESYVRPLPIVITLDRTTHERCPSLSPAPVKTWATR